jgi:phage terminase large subunit
MQYRILAYYQGTGEDITHYLRELQTRQYVYGTVYLPHDGAAKRLGEKKSIEAMIRGAGYRVHIVPRTAKVDSVNAARLILPNCWFDEEECTDGISALRHYRYRVVDGQLSNEPVHDWASDGADAFATLALALKTPKGPSQLVEKLRKVKDQFSDKYPGLGWMG